MPKLKSHSGAAKRFTKTASGKIKFRRANRNHILTKRTTKSKRNLRVGTSLLCHADTSGVNRLLTGS